MGSSPDRVVCAFIVVSILFCWQWASVLNPAATLSSQDPVAKPTIDVSASEVLASAAAPVDATTPMALPTEAPATDLTQYLKEYGPLYGDMIGNFFQDVADCAAAATDTDAANCCRDVCELTLQCTFWKMDMVHKKCQLGSQFHEHTPWEGHGDLVGSFSFKSKAAPIHVRDIIPVMPLAEELAVQRAELERDCFDPGWKPGTATPSRQSLRAWLEWALPQPEGQARYFPEHNLLMSTKTCRRYSDELKSKHRFIWFMLGPTGKEPTNTNDTTLRDLASRNPRNHQLLKKPYCPGGPREVWAYRCQIPPYEQLKAPPPIKARTAVLDADVWGNIGHSFASIMWMDSAYHNADLKLAGAPPEVVPTWSSLQSHTKEEHSHYFPLVKMFLEALGLPSLRELANNHKNELKEKDVECYQAVAQRMMMWPRPQDFSYKRRTLKHCKIEATMMKRKVLFWYKRVEEVGHAAFVDMAHVRSLMQNWTRSRGLELQVTTLSKDEVDTLGPCGQVKLFSDVALYVGVHGAAGIHSVFLPEGAVYVEMNAIPKLSARLPAGRARTSWDGYYSELAALTGALYVSYFHGLPMQPGRINGKQPRYFFFDFAELIARLDQIYELWLMPRLPPVQ